nr:hypothetical protein [Tanacetum cinerariifolium]
MWKNTCPDEEDVFDDMTDMNAELKVAAWNVRGKDKRVLWKELQQYTKDIDDKPWVLMGDWNECLEDIEVEDLNSSGVHFTWVQSRHNPSSGILKKIILIIPKMIKWKHKSFRFINFIVDKPGFLSTVQEEWNIQVEGCRMYSLVKKLKALKFHLKRQSWKYGNIFEK